MEILLQKLKKYLSYKDYVGYSVYFFCMLPVGLALFLDENFEWWNNYFEVNPEGFFYFCIPAIVMFGFVVIISIVELIAFAFEFYHKKRLGGETIYVALFKVFKVIFFITFVWFIFMYI